MPPLSPWWPLIRRRTITFSPITSARTWAFATPRCISSTFTTTQTTSCWRASRLSRTFSRFSTTGSLVSKWNAGKNKALLYINKLCQGSKGPSIKYRAEWLTPNEFQFVSGRETAKDWKRSIRHKGKSCRVQPNGYSLWNKGSCSLRRVRELIELLFLGIKIRVAEEQRV